ncbi:MAG: PHP domain-containing protein [Candidatus Sumerlaea chitinivorans]|nr:PHP domain-containing protein [Candidatus Sumerlaea chitinivorans]
MKTFSFVHLHVHSHYSLEDGIASVDELVARAAELGMEALALTDHNSLGGAVAFTQACRRHSIKPILGAELDVPPLSVRVRGDVYFRLLFLVADPHGYENLVKLITIAQSNRTSAIFPITADVLAEYATGLVVLAGGRASELYYLLDHGNELEADAHLAHLVRIFGSENVLVELQDFGQPRDAKVNTLLAGLARHRALRLVATNDVHYVRPDDAICYDLLKGEPAPQTLPITPPSRCITTRHLATAAEMSAKFASFPEALSATIDIADRCNFKLALNRDRFPVHEFCRGFDADAFLGDLTFREIHHRFPETTPEIKLRLDEEFQAIRELSLARYFLFLWEIAQFCRSQGIVLGAGRSELLSSLTAYTLGITQVNPLEFKFRPPTFSANQALTQAIEIEVPLRHVPAVLAHLQETFGRHRCCWAGAYEKMKKEDQLRRKIAEWYGCRPKDLERPSAEIVARLEGSPLPPLQELFPAHVNEVQLPHPAVTAYLMQRLGQRFSHLRQLQDELVVSGESLDRLVPRISVNGDEVSQMDAAALSALGIPRLVVVHSDMLDILDKASELVRAEENPRFDPQRIPLDDDDTYALFGRGATTGLGPFNSITLKSLLRRQRPTTFMGLFKVKTNDPTNQADIQTHVAHCLIAYRCAYIKAHYPLSFMTALLSHYLINRLPLEIPLREARQMGLRVLPPHINRSVYEFSIENRAIRMGLGMIYGVGRKVYAEIERARRGREFTDLHDLCQRTEPSLVKSDVLANLIKAGALDCFEMSRAQMLRLVEEHGKLLRKSDSASLFDSVGENAGIAELVPPEEPELPLAHRLQLEVAATGITISQDLMECYRDEIRRCRAISPRQLSRRMVRSERYVVGFVDHIEEESPLAEKGDQVLIDLEGYVVTMPTRLAAHFAPVLSSKQPVMLGGQVDCRGDEVFLRAMSAFTLPMIAEMGAKVLALELNLANEDSRTLRMLARIAGQYRGGKTTLRIQNSPPGALSRFLHFLVERTHVFFCPPFYDALRKLLPEKCIRIVPAPDTDPMLLHVLEPTVFPKPERNNLGASD